MLSYALGKQQLFRPVASCCSQVVEIYQPSSAHQIWMMLPNHVVAIFWHFGLICPLGPLFSLGHVRFSIGFHFATEVHPGLCTSAMFPDDFTALQETLSLADRSCAGQGELFEQMSNHFKASMKYMKLIAEEKDSTRRADSSVKKEPQSPKMPQTKRRRRGSGLDVDALQDQQGKQPTPPASALAKKSLNFDDPPDPSDFDLTDWLLQDDALSLEEELERARKHPMFEAYERSIRLELSGEADGWTFGDMEGAPDGDLEDFLIYIRRKKDDNSKMLAAIENDDDDPKSNVHGSVEEAALVAAVPATPPAGEDPPPPHPISDTVEPTLPGAEPTDQTETEKPAPQVIEQAQDPPKKRC